MEDYEKSLRPGDVLVSQGHAVLYIGENKILHCNGAKLDKLDLNHNKLFYMIFEVFPLQLE